MREFWGSLEHELPELNEEQQARLQVKAEAHPTHRIMPAPLNALPGRNAMVETAKAVFPKIIFGRNGSGMFDEHGSGLDFESTSFYGELLAHLGATIQFGDPFKLRKKYYGMRYKTPSGTAVVGRADYKNDLDAAGKTVKGEHDIPWTWSVMDVAVRSPRTNAPYEALHGRVSPTATPEAHIGMCLLHLANGTPNTDFEPDFVNEAVFELDKRGSVKALYGAGSVLWNSGTHDLAMKEWAERHDSLGVRAEESGL